jgi:hypothetical protein
MSKKTIFCISFALLSTCAGLLLDYLIRGISAYTKTTYFASPMVDGSFPYIVVLVFVSGGLSIWASAFVEESLRKITLGMSIISMLGFICLKLLN